MPFANVNGTRLSYVQVEPTHGGRVEDLVMVHGLATSLAFWYMRYAAAFSERFRITFFDLRGHGNSEITPAGYSPSSLAKDLEGLMDHLGIRRAHVVAHSFGGVVALGLAKLDPSRISSLVLADTQISAGRSALRRKIWEHGQVVGATLGRCGIELDTQDPYFGYHLLTAVSALIASGANPPPEITELVGPLLGKYGARTAKRWLNLVTETSARGELIADDELNGDSLDHASFPTLAMYGDRSQAYCTRDELLALLPQAELLALPGAGHFFPATRPEEVTAACCEFWNEMLPPSQRFSNADVLSATFNRSSSLF